MLNELKSAEEWTNILLQEHERAIKQRDTFILTGISTASHGGSHDTCFKYIVEQIQINAYKAGMTAAAEIVVTCPELRFGDIKQAILSARDKKESL